MTATAPARATRRQPAEEGPVDLAARVERLSALVNQALRRIELIEKTTGSRMSFESPEGAGPFITEDRVLHWQSAEVRLAPRHVGLLHVLIAHAGSYPVRTNRKRTREISKLRQHLRSQGNPDLAELAAGLRTQNGFIGLDLLWEVGDELGAQGAQMGAHRKVE